MDCSIAAAAAAAVANASAYQGHVCELDDCQNNTLRGDVPFSKLGLLSLSVLVSQLTIEAHTSRMLEGVEVEATQRN